jgi:hypothetical protein
VSSNGDGVGAPEDTPIDYVNKDFALRGLVTKFSLRARRKFYDQFLAECRPGPECTILDVGVTPDTTIADSNYLERWYPYPGRITATSIEDASAIESAFPGVQFIRTSGPELPFADKSFDIAFSSAVVEHVGDAASQQRFLSEMLRVAHTVFLTTPNRWFPMELHTFLPLVHWLPQRWHQRVLRTFGMHGWASTENLNLLSAKSLVGLFPSGQHVTLGGPKFLGVKTNLVVVTRDHHTIAGA